MPPTFAGLYPSGLILPGVGDIWQVSKALGR